MVSESVRTDNVKIRVRLDYVSSRVDKIRRTVIGQGGRERINARQAEIASIPGQAPASRVDPTEPGR